MQVVQGAGLQELPECRLWSFVVCSRLLSALLLCLWCAVLEYAPISHFKGVFRGFYGVCVGLYGLRAFCCLCDFCARVELGG